MLNPHQITQDLCAETFGEILRDYIGVGRELDTRHAAEELGIERRTVQSYLLGENLPPFVTLMRMMALFGPGFANRVIVLAGLTGSRFAAGRDVSDLELNGDVCTVVGEMGRALRDGRIDHHEKSKLIGEVRTMSEASVEWLVKNDPNYARSRRLNS